MGFLKREHERHQKYRAFSIFESLHGDLDKA